MSKITCSVSLCANGVFTEFQKVHLASAMKSSPQQLALILVLIADFMKETKGLIDPVSIGTIASVGAALYNYKTVLRYTVCQFNECCNDDYIVENWDGLKDDLNRNVYGQKLAIDALIATLKAHSGKERSMKPLVISLHGTVGTGKTFTSDFIAEWMFKNKGSSKFVHKFVPSMFPSRNSHLYEYQEKIKKTVRDALLACPRSLFIFEEVDKYQLGIFDGITSYLEYYGRIDGVDVGRAVFIFISNTAGTEVSKKLASLYQYGVVRDHLTLSHFENILELGSYNLDGGFKLSSLIESKLIDHFIPFLPLERDQVAMCIKAVFHRYHRTPSKADINTILENEVIFDSSGIFATSGCKRIERKVELFVS